MWAGQGCTIKLLEYGHLFLCPWYILCQFSTISYVIELQKKLSNKNCHFLKTKTKVEIFGLRDPPEAQFYWKVLKLGIRSAKSIKKCPYFSNQRVHPCRTTLTVFRIVLLHTEASGKRLFGGSVEKLKGSQSHLIFL